MVKAAGLTDTFSGILEIFYRFECQQFPISFDFARLGRRPVRKDAPAQKLCRRFLQEVCYCIELFWGGCQYIKRTVNPTGIHLILSLFLSVMGVPRGSLSLHRR